MRPRLILASGYLVLVNVHLLPSYAFPLSCQAFSVHDFTGESKAGYRIVYMIVPFRATLQALQNSWYGWERLTN
jgi:hypothetical protein